MRSIAKYILFIFFFICSVIISTAQTKKKKIWSIQKKSEMINRDTTINKVVLENEEFLENMTDHGGELVGSYKMGKIKKIYEWIGLSNGISITEFYFDNEQLIFVYEQFNSFVFDDKEEEFDLAKTKTIFEGRYYFSNKKLFNQSTKGDKSKAAQQESTQSLLARAIENMETLNKKKLQ